MAAMSGAWLRKKDCHPWLGGPRRLTMYLATLDCATSSPSLSSSPWMRGAVESRCGAVALGRTYPLPPLSSGGALVVPPSLRFHIPLIEPDRQISRIRLSDKTSRLRVQRLLQLLNIYRS